MKKVNSKDAPVLDSQTALLLIDVISDFEFEDGEKLYEFALQAARAISNLKKRARKAGMPIIYINDNLGKWRDDFQKTVEHCLQKDRRGYEIVKLLKPLKDDYFVIKPKHSAFYSTTLDVLLAELNVETLILTGISTDICVLFTANDAYMRGFRLFVPEDCVAAVDPQENTRSLKYIERVLKAEIRNSKDIDFVQANKPKSKESSKKQKNNVRN